MSAKAGGKHVDLVWALAHGATGTADPAFDAHAGPIKYWALAFWEGWFDEVAIEETLGKARAKLNVTGKSIWGRVTGPATALVATLARLKWSWVSGRKVRDDIGNVLSFGIDAPKDFVTAANASVRRWRLERVARLFPQLVPDNPDVHTPTSSPTILVDFFNVVAQMIKGKVPTKKLTAMWSSKWSPSLASALNGGQWTQARKAKVATWMIDDSRCQLCFKAVGTVDHRFSCEATRARSDATSPRRRTPRWQS